jgi:hypothetical protein
MTNVGRFVFMSQKVDKKPDTLSGYPGGSDFTAWLADGL